MMKMRSQIFCFATVIAATSCASLATSQTYRVGASGFATVENAPSTPPVAEPARPTSSMFSDMNRFQKQWEHNDEMQRIWDRLKVEEAGNFAEMRIEWEPEFHYLVSFRKDAKATLAKYTTNPIFKPHIVGFTETELQEKSALFHQRNITQNVSSHVDVQKGRVMVFPGIYENELDDYPGYKAFADDPMIEFVFNIPLDPSGSISREALPLIKYLAREKTRRSMVLTSLTIGKIVLRDGCFFLDTKGNDDPLVLFHEEVGVGIDDDGYIVLINRMPIAGNDRMTRVGELGGWGDGTRTVTKASVVAPLQDACGPHRVVAIGTPSPHRK